MENFGHIILGENEVVELEKIIYSPMDEFENHNSVDLVEFLTKGGIRFLRVTRGQNDERTYAPKIKKGQKIIGMKKFLNFESKKEFYAPSGQIWEISEFDVFKGFYNETLTTHLWFWKIKIEIPS